MDTYPLDEAKESLATLIEQATFEQKQCRIHSDIGNVVLLSEETYDNLLITLELLSTPGLIEGMKDIQSASE